MLISMLRSIRVTLALALVSMLVSVSVAHAGKTLLASYEPSETNLTLIPNSGDTGLTCNRVLASSVVLPDLDVLVATDGDYVLALNMVGEDGKIEFTHQWSGFTYDLTGNKELLVDVYIPETAMAPTLMGIWSSNWNPPDAWQQAAKPARAVGIWTTVSFDVSTRNQVGLDNIWAMIFEGLSGGTGTIYIDNLRLSDGVPENVQATGHDHRIDLTWDEGGASCTGYNIYRADSETGSFYRLNSATHTVTAYSDILSSNDRTYYYKVKGVYTSGQSLASSIVSGTSWEMNDEELMTSVQEATFRYFWNFAHPVSGLAREGLWHDRDTVTTGGTGMGLITIIVGVERGFITRSEAAAHVLKMLTFLDESCTRYYGAWSHHINGQTGETIPFGGEDNGADIVETAFLIEGMLTVREYFDADDPVELEIRKRATSMWEEVEWDWFLRWVGGQLLHWHWSPDYGFDVEGTRPVIGYDETMIAYLLAIASPTHPIPASCYYNGWTTGDGYDNGDWYYGYQQWVGWGGGGPLFWTHYSFLGFDPRNKSDNFCNYYLNCQNISRIHREYCIDNPGGYADYSDLVWGLTTCYGPYGYCIHEPQLYRDNGTIAPTAAISAMAFTPTESRATLRHFYETYLSRLWGEFGFRDGMNPTLSWYSNTYIAIDQGPQVPMIENSRTGLCWDIFMKNPEIEPMLRAIGWTINRSPRNPENPEQLAAGLEYEYYEADAASPWNRLPYFDALTPDATGIISGFDLSPRQQEDYFAFRFTGYIDIPASGIYTFYTNSDDGSRLYLGDDLVVDNDGLHGLDGDVSGSITLLAGKHEITVLFFDKTQGQDLNVSYMGPGIAKTAIPASVLFRDGQVGADDLSTFANCLAGPDVSVSSECRSMDMDGDSDVDLYDFSVFMSNFVVE